MLDEIKEFQQYTSKISKINLDTCRLKYSTLIKDNDFSGIERALTMIARGYIFNFNKEPVNIFNVEQENRIKETLKAWCGLNSNVDKSDINCWLANYMRSVLLLQTLKKSKGELNKSTLFNALQKRITTEQDKKLKEKTGKQKKKSLPDSEIEKLKQVKEDDLEAFCNNYLKLLKDIENSIKKETKILKNKKSIFEKQKDADSILVYFKNLNYDFIQICHIIDALQALKRKTSTFDNVLFPDKFTKANDYKAITFEKIIANAFNMGPLKKLVLACNANPWNPNEKNKTDSLAVRKFTGNNEGGLNLKDSDRDLILKITAYYLLQKRQSDQEYVVFNQTDLANWLRGNAKSGGFELDKYKFKVTEKKETVVNSDNANQNITFTYVPLFSTITIGATEKNKNGIGLSKIKLHPEWVQRFKLVEINENSNLKLGKQKIIYLFDRGGGQYLEEKNNTGLPVYQENAAKEDKISAAKKKTFTKK